MQLSTSTKLENADSRLLTALRTELSSQPRNRALRSVVELLRKDSDRFDWVGIYLVKENDLVLEAYAGESETEHVEIPIGQGICGLAAKQGETIVVPDVNKDPRYLMCFPSTRSEIVVPIRGSAAVLGEIDIDSDRLSAFLKTDQKLLERAAEMLADYLEQQPITGEYRNSTR